MGELRSSGTFRTLLLLDGGRGDIALVQLYALGTRC